MIPPPHRPQQLVIERAHWTTQGLLAWRCGTLGPASAVRPMMAVEYVMLPKYAMLPGLFHVPETVTDDNANQVVPTWFKAGPMLSQDALDDRHGLIARVACERCSP